MDQKQVFDEIQDYVKGAELDIELLVDVSGSMKQGNRLAQALEISKAAANVGALVDEDEGPKRRLDFISASRILQSRRVSRWLVSTIRR